MKLFTLAFTCVLSLGLFASAESVEETATLVFKSQDGDKDGTITLEEVKVVLTKFIGLMLKAGTDEEKAQKAADEYKFAMNFDMFLRADQDDDLKVNRDDVTKFITDLRAGTPGKLTSKDCDVLGRETIAVEWEWNMLHSDTDKDGKMSKEEFVDKNPWAGEGDEFTIVDKDKDGNLSKEEAAAIYTRKVRVDNGYPADPKDEEKEEE